MVASTSAMAAKVESANKVKASLMDMKTRKTWSVRQLARRLDEVEQSVREVRDRDLRRRPSQWHMISRF